MRAIEAIIEVTAVATARLSNETGPTTKLAADQ